MEVIPNNKVSIKDILQHKDRGVSVLDILKQSIDLEMDDVVIVGTKDGKIYTGCSHSNVLELLGALSYAQADVYNNLEQEE